MGPGGCHVALNLDLNPLDVGDEEEMTDWLNQIHIGDALTILKQMPDEFVHCVITSPPYW